MTMEEATSAISSSGVPRFQLERETLACLRPFLLESLNICDHLALALRDKEVITAHCASKITQDWLRNSELVGLLLAELLTSDLAKLTLFWEELYFASSEEYRDVAKYILRAQENRHAVRRRVEDSASSRDDHPSANVPELSRAPAAEDTDAKAVVAEGTSQDRDPWKEDAFKKEYSLLIQGMDPQTARRLAYEKELITPEIRNRLRAEQDPATHNESLLAHLEAFGARTFVGFVDILKAMGPNFATTHANLSALLSSRSNDQDDRAVLDRILSREAGHTGTESEAPIRQVSGPEYAEQVLSALFPDPTKGDVSLAIVLLEHTTTASSSNAWKCMIVRRSKGDAKREGLLSRVRSFFRGAGRSQENADESDGIVQPASDRDRVSYSVYTLYAENPDLQTRWDEIEKSLLRFFKQEIVLGPKPTSNEQSDRSMLVVIRVAESISTFKDRCYGFLHFVAGLLRVERDQIAMTGLRNGSVILLLVVPMEAVTRLTLLALLQPYKLFALGITEVFGGYGTTITTGLPKVWAPSTTSADSVLATAMDVTKADWWKETVDSGTVDDDVSEPLLTRAYRVANAFMASKGDDDWLMESFATISSSAIRQRDAFVIPPNQGSSITSRSLTVELETGSVAGQVNVNVMVTETPRPGDAYPETQMKTDQHVAFNKPARLSVHIPDIDHVIREKPEAEPRVLTSYHLGDPRELKDVTAVPEYNCRTGDGLVQWNSPHFSKWCVKAKKNVRREEQQLPSDYHNVCIEVQYSYDNKQCDVDCKLWVDRKGFASTAKLHVLGDGGYRFSARLEFSTSRITDARVKASLSGREPRETVHPALESPWVQLSELPHDGILTRSIPFESRCRLCHTAPIIMWTVEGVGNVVLVQKSVSLMSLEQFRQHRQEVIVMQ